MEGATLKSRAIAFAFCVGATAFILSILAVADRQPTTDAVTRALVVAIICGAMSWASAERALWGVAMAVDAAISRVVAAAEGDLRTSTPDIVSRALPVLSGALDEMFAQVKDKLDSANSLALFDPVTALANRTHFRHEAERVLELANDSDMGAVVFIDLDHFKRINDTLGHAQGDQLLISVANRLRAVAAAETVRRRGDAGDTLIGRLAGDEFTILFPNLAGRHDAARLGGNILAALQRPFDLDGQEVTLGASVGISMYPEDGRMLTPLMRAADVAMYHAKASGRGQFQFYAETLAERMARRTQLEVELREALVRDEFTVMFQPQIDLSSGRVHAVEGLIRWQHPTDGIRLPGSFLETAEESGLIHDIGDWAIEALAEWVARWPHNALAPRLAVNLSPRQITRPEFFARLNGALSRQQAPLSVIEFEVSESVLMDASPRMLVQIARLREHGATIAIDDFGAGSSSLARLRTLPFDTVKLDSTLIDGIENDAAARDMVQAIIGLVHSFGARAVAEGVETAAQLDIVRVMGCDAAQGYAIAAPMSEQDYAQWSANTAARMRA